MKIIWFRCADLKDNKNLQSVPLEGYRIKKTTGLEEKQMYKHKYENEGTINDNHITLQLMTEAELRNATAMGSWNRICDLEGQEQYYINNLNKPKSEIIK